MRPERHHDAGSTGGWKGMQRSHWSFLSDDCDTLSHHEYLKVFLFPLSLAFFFLSYSSQELNWARNLCLISKTLVRDQSSERKSRGAEMPWLRWEKRGSRLLHAHRIIIIITLYNRSEQESVSDASRRDAESGFTSVKPEEESEANWTAEERRKSRAEDTLGHSSLQ